MKPLLRLTDYYTTRLHLDVHFPGSTTNTDAGETPRFSFSVSQNPKNKFETALRMGVHAFSSVAKDGPICEIDAEMLGIFTFDPKSNSEEIAFLTSLNGATILYGILRGIVSSMAGHLPCGRIVLPTVYMQEVLENALAQEGDSPTGKKTGRRKSPGKTKATPRKSTKRPPSDSDKP